MSFEQLGADLQTNSDVLVIGTGVIAKATALALAERGRAVTIFAPQDHLSRSATHASGAMLGAFAEFTVDRDDEASRAEGDLRVAAGRLWQDWFDNLATMETAAAVRRGTFIIASNNGVGDVENVEFIAAKAALAGQRAEWVEARDVTGLHPHRLSRPLKVLALPDEGYIDSGVLLNVLAVALDRSTGVTVVDDRAHRIGIDGALPAVVSVKGETWIGDHLVIAAGVESDALLRQLEFPGGSGALRLLGGRGVSAVVRTGEVFGGVLRTPNREFACGTHLVPLEGGRAYLGATNRLELDTEAVPLPALGELHSLAHSLTNEINVGLRTSSVLETRVGYRPISADGLPIFGRTAHPRVSVATGTYRNGVLMAPVIAAAVADEVVGAPSSAPNRFSPLARESLFSDRDITATMIASLRQVVSFVQEPDGNLPFDRARELESLLSAFLRAAIGAEGGTEVLAAFERLTTDYPISEAMPLLMYEVSGR